MRKAGLQPLPSVVASDESLARYLTQSNHFSAPSRVKPRAFDPPDNLRLSVFRTNGLDTSQIWAIGEEYLQPRTIYGSADIKASAVEEVGLQIDPDNTPPRHACIVGWPEDRAAQKSIAQQLAAIATLRLRS